MGLLKKGISDYSAIVCFLGRLSLLKFIARRETAEVLFLASRLSLRFLPILVSSYLVGFPWVGGHVVPILAQLIGKPLLRLPQISGWVAVHQLHRLEFRYHIVVFIAEHRDYLAS